MSTSSKLGVVARRGSCRYADDWVCAFQYREEAEAFYRVLPKRLAKFNLAVAPEKTRLLRFSRFHPGLTRRFAFLGFEFYWDIDRQGEPRLKKRTDRKRLRSRLAQLHRVGEVPSPLSHQAAVWGAQSQVAGLLQ